MRRLVLKAASAAACLCVAETALRAANPDAAVKALFPKNGEMSQAVVSGIRLGGGYRPARAQGCAPALDSKC